MMPRRRLFERYTPAEVQATEVAFRSGPVTLQRLRRRVRGYVDPTDVPGLLARLLADELVVRGRPRSADAAVYALVGDFQQTAPRSHDAPDL